MSARADAARASADTTRGPSGARAGDARAGDAARAGDPVERAGASVRSWPIWPLLLVAALVRIPGLGADPWFDEIWMLDEFVRHPLAKSLTTYTTDNHHPLYTVLAWFCVRAFGEEPWALRLPAYAFGVASIGALYALARHRIGRRGAWLACFFLALSSHHVSFSQNARGYTAVLFFSLVSCHGFLSALERGGRRSAIVQGVALGLATWSHLTAVFVAAGQVVAWGIEASRGNRRAAPLLGVVLGALVSLALHAPLLKQMIGFFFLGEGRPRVEAEWTSPLWTLFEITRSAGIPDAAAAAALVVAAAVLALGLWRVARQNVALAVLCAVPVVLCAGAMLALGRNLWPRLFFFAAGFAALVLVEGMLGAAELVLRATGAHEVERRERGAALLAGLAILATAVLLPRVWLAPKQDFAGARAYVEQHRKDGEAALTVGLATFPYQAWYGGDFTPVASAEELDQVLAGGRGGYAISTFPIYLSSRHPDLAAALDARAREVARFRGSIGGGDVVVLRVD